MGVRVPLPPHCLTHKLRIMIVLREFTIGSFYHINAYEGNEEVGRLGIEIKDIGKVYLTYVSTDIKHTNKGIATKLLNRAIEVFNDCEIKLLVKPMPRDGEKIEYRTTKGLIEFYKKFGFERTDDPLMPTMIRKATLPTLGV